MKSSMRRHGVRAGGQLIGCNAFGLEEFSLGIQFHIGCFLHGSIATGVGRHYKQWIVLGER